MIQQCSDKVTELCKLEKETWQTVDTLNEKYEAMMNQVETTKERQVLEVQPAGQAVWLGDSRTQATDGTSGFHANSYIFVRIQSGFFDISALWSQIPNRFL